MDKKYEHIHYGREDGVVTLTLNRPEKLNAFTPSMRLGLMDYITQSAEDKDVKVVVITAKGRAFCVGADVKYLRGDLIASEIPEGWPRIGPPSLSLVKMREMGKPVIAAINGMAYGGGLGLALAPDIRIASDKARFGAMFIRRGLAGEWGVTDFLPKILGRERALYFLWRGEEISAQQALELGLVTKVVPHDDLMAETMALAGTLAKGPSLAIQQVKKLIDASYMNDFEKQLQLETYAAMLLTRTADFKEGVASFFEKREPHYKGE